MKTWITARTEVPDVNHVIPASRPPLKLETSAIKQLKLAVHALTKIVHHIK